MANADSFLVAVCQIGAERALKHELTTNDPALRPAFARPGLVTFKSTALSIGPDFALQSVFARAFAAALGPAREVNEVIAIADRVRKERRDIRLRLHVFERDRHRPGEELPVSDENLEDGALARDLESRLRGAATDTFLEGTRAQSNDLVLDVIVAKDEPCFIGQHVHSALHSPFPGGRIPVEVPADAPSRAYRKVEEAIAWSGAPLKSGQIAVEVGSAPGGASLALLRRGLEVIGIDPGAMAEIVLADPRFRHLQSPVAAIATEDLPRRADWLLLDVNLAPQVALHSIRRLVAALRTHLRGVLFTLKLNDWEMAREVPDFLRRMEGMGLSEVRATQLPGNRQEIFAYGVMRRK